MNRIFRIAVLSLFILALASAAFAQGRGRFSGNQRNTYGWQLMTAQERAEHQAKMRSFTDFGTCQAYIQEHHQAMEERAKAKGLAAPSRVQDPCTRMKARGLLK